MSNLIRKFRSLVRAWKFGWTYRTNRWGDPESRSGTGSNKDSGSVRHALEILNRVTEQYHLTSVADIPCGDFNWIDAYLAEHPEVAYVGYDIVGSLVRDNRQRFARFKFVQLDIVSRAPPASDLIFCKDLLNHLHDQEIFDAIANMRRSGSTWLLTTNNFGYEYVPLGEGRHQDSRHVDLTLPPFNYPPPVFKDHYFGLWRLRGMEPR